MMTYLTRIALPVAVGLAAMLLLIGLYLAVAVLGRSPQAALALLWDNKRAVLPLGLGFGIQAGLYTLLRKGLHGPIHVPAGRTTTAASGGTSALAMVACCAASTGVNILPIVLSWLGLTAASTLVAQGQMPFMIASVLSSLLGISVMGYAAIKALRRQAHSRVGAIS